MIIILAWRNIWRNKARSAVIIASVGLGLLTGLFVLAIYEGMMLNRVKIVIEDEVSHIQVHHPGFKVDMEATFTIPQGKELINAARQMPAVRAVAPRLIAPGMLATGTGSAGVEIRGVDPAAERLVSGLDKKIIAGRYFLNAGKNELLLGQKLLEKMKLKPGNKVVLTFCDKDNTVVAGAFRIAGIYETYNSLNDERIVYVQDKDLGKLLNTGNGYHELAVRLRRDEDLDMVRKDFQKNFPQLTTETWKELSPETDLTVTTVSQFSLIIIIIIMLALSFGIINTMLMAVLERTRETGMMLAIGMSKTRLFLLVLFETAFLTLIGSPAGLLLAWAVIYYTGSTGINVASFAKDLMGEFGYGNIIYPVFPLRNLAAVVLIVMLTALVSSVFPAIKALSLRPVEALRK